jgi:hypothetical protein
MGGGPSGVRRPRRERLGGKHRSHHEVLVGDRERSLALGVDAVMVWRLGIENRCGVWGISRRPASVDRGP